MAVSYNKLFKLLIGKKIMNAELAEKLDSVLILSRGLKGTYTSPLTVLKKFTSFLTVVWM